MVEAGRWGVLRGPATQDTEDTRPPWAPPQLLRKASEWCSHKSLGSTAGAPCPASSSSVLIAKHRANKDSEGRGELPETTCPPHDSGTPRPRETVSVPHQDQHQTDNSQQSQGVPRIGQVERLITSYERGRPTIKACFSLSFAVCRQGTGLETRGRGVALKTTRTAMTLRRPGLPFVRNTPWTFQSARKSRVHSSSDLR